MWARERRVWASGGQAPASPGLAHTLHRTALGAQDASPSSPLGVTRAAVVVSAPRGTRQELARAGGRTPPGHGRCSFAMRRGLPASNTFRPRRGARQPSSGVRITPTGDAHWHATAPVRARARAGRGSLAGTAPRATPPFRRLPDCLAARLPGELDTVEAMVAHAEQAPSLAAAANELRRDAVELAGAMRWVERRVRLVHHVLSIVIGLLPDLLARCVAEVGAVRTRLETDTALRALRTLTDAHLPVLPAPLGFPPPPPQHDESQASAPTQDGT